ncbi:unannotated protein [freshwater metagenome]|uniref:Unannotated protein n=1 Tax=freshwater metagenome TaxID=449393 RepID=A0A6J7EFA9_9ZZZZ|nr:VOC family protein [Actinomycetota bacterium]
MSSDAAAQVAPSHFGLCVTDLERSLRFYCDGLGFAKAEGYTLDDTMLPALARSLEVGSPVAVTSQFITLGSMKIELLHYANPAVFGTPSASRGQIGFTHLSFFVDDVDASAARLVALGGTIIEATRANLGIEVVFLADPDGARVELMSPMPRPSTAS